MADCLWTGEPFWHIISDEDQLSLSSVVMMMMMLMMMKDESTLAWR